MAKDVDAKAEKKRIDVYCKVCGRLVAGYIQGQGRSKRIRAYRHERAGVMPGNCRGSNKPATPALKDAV